MARRPGNVFAKERDAILSRGGMVRMSDALRLGISRKTFYAMRDTGVLEQLSRGLYRLRDLPPLGSPDLVTVATRARKESFASSLRSLSTSSRPRCRTK
jgi:hypothetical protein